MTMHASIPLRHTPYPTPGLSRLATAIAASLFASAAAAAGDVQSVSAIRAVAHPDGHVSLRLEMQPASTLYAARQRPGTRTSAQTVPRKQTHTATNLPVTSCLDDDSPGTLRAVVASAGEGDTVDLSQLQCSRIVLQQGMIETNWMNVDLSIQGPGRDALTIDGAGLDGVFYNGGSGTLTLRDLSLANGRVVDGWGACVCAPGGSVSLSRVSVSSCLSHQVTDLRGAGEGGAIFAFGNVSLEDSEIRDSTMLSDLPGGIPDGSGEGITIYPVLGGAIANLLGDIKLERSRISGNSAIATARGGVGEVKGGGLNALSGNIVISDSVLSDNQVSSAFTDVGGYSSFAVGGGLYSNYGDLTITGSTIAGNKVQSSANIYWDRGGGIAFSGTSATIQNTTIENNQASGDSGGLHHQGHILRLVNSTVSGNYAGRGTGGLYDVNPSSLDHVTIAFNRSGAGIGGALLLRSGDIQSSIIANNSSGGTEAADLHSGGNVAVSGNHNLIGDAGTLELPADTLHSDPQLIPLAENGGPTRTHALAKGSPAIDAGSNASNLDHDQRGTGFARVWDGASDIGAFEFQVVVDKVFADGFDADLGDARH